MAAPTRPVLRYHGGKWMLAPWIIQYLPPHRVYVEPYGGGASVLLRKPRSYAEVYNDLDDEVVNVFAVLRDPAAAAQLRELLELTPYSRTEFFRAYESATDPVERARRRIIRAAMSFGTSSGKKNRTGFRATPWRCGGSHGAQDFVTFPRALAAFTERLRGVCIDCRPALEVIAQQDAPEVLFYCDPPYPRATRSAIRWPSDNERAYAHDMADEDHRELARVLGAVRGMVVVSGYPCNLYDVECFPGWTRVQMATLADGAKKRTEVLWINPRAAAALEGRLW